jgi:hypothetical protein
MKHVYKRPKMYPKQEEAFFTDRRISCIEASTKAGKAMHHLEPVLTPSGEVPISKLQVGDVVVDPHGGVANVTGVFPQGVKALYRFSVQGVGSVLCCEEHLWKVSCDGVSFVFSTGALIGLLEDDVEVMVPVYENGFLSLEKLTSIEFETHDEAVCISVDSQKRLFVTRSGIVTHNTHAAVAWIFEKALIEGKPGRNYWWVAPISGQAEIAFRRMKLAIPFKDLYKDNQVQQYITLPNDARIWFKSGDKPDSLYGEDVFGAVIDEASRVKEESWHAVRSTLTATRGPIRLIGNVKGKNNWFYKLSRVAESGADPNMYYEKITAIDAVAAGVLDVQEILDAKKIYPENVFKELYLAEPSDDHGNPFGWDHIEACVFKDKDGKPTQKLADGPPVAFGWDVAKSTNWTVGIGLNRKGQVCEYYRWRDNWDATIKRILAVTKRKPAYVDSTGGGDPIEEALQRAGGGNFQGLKFSRQSKQDLMVLLATGIQQREVGYPMGEIVKELHAFEYEISPSGNVLYSAPRGVHDDTVDALAMAYKMLKEQQYHSIDVAPIQLLRQSPWAIT